MHFRRALSEKTLRNRKPGQGTGLGEDRKTLNENNQSGKSDWMTVDAMQGNSMNEGLPCIDVLLSETVIFIRREGQDAEDQNTVICFPMKKWSRKKF